MKHATILLFLAVATLHAGMLLVPKPTDVLQPIPFFQQNEPIPEGATADEFIEEAPQALAQPVLPELQMLFFQRPLTDAIWPSSKPRAFEYIERLDGWGAQGQFVTLNFAVYPLSDLKNLTVRVEDCATPSEVRLVRYWNIIYPYYNSYNIPNAPKRYRRMPEFLMPVTSCDAPKEEPQRFYLTFQLPSDGSTEVTGNVLVYHDGCDQAVKLPFRIQILPFQLKQDPAKHYSAYYYYLRYKTTFDFYSKHLDDKELMHKAQQEDFRRMKEYGFTRPPTLNMAFCSLPDGTKDAYYIPEFDDTLEDMKTAGFDLTQPIPVVGSSYFYLYEKFSGKQLHGFHLDDIDCANIPQELYDTIDSALEKFLNYAKAHNYPPMMFNPIDEPSPNSLPYVMNIYRIFKKHGLTTFITSPPDALIRQGDELFDIYSYGMFNVPYEKAVSGDKVEYWCYPNDVAFSKKDPVTMCHGGRLTYGLGFWRSGFHCLMPWIWSTGTPRLCNAGGNMLCPDDGRVFMTTYWECFRLGVDDMRYIYTLEDAVVRRENSENPAVQTLIKDARTLLQKVWDSISPKVLYNHENLLHTAEIDAMRYQMAAMTLKLKAYPETQDVVAKSVIIEPCDNYALTSTQIDSPNMVFHPLTNWIPIAKETTLTETSGKLDVRIDIDHKLAGEGDYLCGWPRIRHFFTKEESDLTKFNAIEFDLTLESDRDNETNYNWPISATLKDMKTNQEVGFSLSVILEPNVKHHISIPISSLESIPKESLKQMDCMQLFICESDYADGSHLHMQVENIHLVEFRSPTILQADVPNYICLPLANFSVPVLVRGVADGNESIARAELIDAKGNVLQTNDTVVLHGIATCGFRGTELSQGEYTIRIRLLGSKGEMQDEQSKALTIF